MKKFRTIASVIIMVIAGIVGFFVGASVNEANILKCLYNNE